MEKQMTIYKNIKDLKNQKILLNNQLSKAIFEKDDFSEEEIQKVINIKKNIKEINLQIAKYKKEIEELDKNNTFECSYSVVTENGKTTETYKVNGNEVSKIEYFKSLKENSLSRRNFFDNFHKSYENNFLNNPFFNGRNEFLENKHDRNECECKRNHKEKDTDIIDVFLSGWYI